MHLSEMFNVKEFGCKIQVYNIGILRQQFKQLAFKIMLHEILCALQGKTGSIIKKYENEICVDPSVNYLSKPEIQLINQICKCGFHYQKIVSLISSQLSDSSLIFSASKSPSMYRKAMYEGLKIAMNEYVQLILAIEQQFLRNRHFTFANLRAQLQPFQLVMNEISQIIYFIYNQNLRGGLVINYLYNKYENSNIIVRKWLYHMLKSTIRVFINQVSMWILYGQIQDTHGEFFIHKVLTQASEKYKFKSKAGRHIQITDWDMFTLEQFVVPNVLIQLQTAGKILFIGKSVKILKSANKISSIPQNLLLNKINNAMGEEYSQIAFEGVIEEIRQVIARQMIEFIMKEQNLIKQLEKLNAYYLMFKGDFYHHFFQQAKGIQTIAQKEKAQKKINDVYLNNTFIRLGEHEDIKRLHFELKTLGFSYSTFKNFINLCPVGNVDLLEGKSIRFNSTGSAVWNRSKQVIESSFTMIFSFNFKKIKQISLANKINKSNEPTYLNFIMQNSKEISGSIHQNPAYLSRIGQYVALKIGFQFSEKEKNYVSSMLLVARDARMNEKEKLLGICNPKGINFMDQKSYSVKLHYSNQSLKAEVSGENGGKGEIVVDELKLGNYIEFQMGRSYLGFISTINEGDYIADLEQWQMICKPSSFYNSHWSDLSLNFKIEWPINLIITQDLIEAYSRIHKFLFPIRQLQIQLESIWFQLPRLIKSEKRTTKEEVRELRTFEKNLAALRSEIQLVINNFWMYFQADIAQILWSKLQKALQSQKDFEDVIASVNKYVKSIQVMYFFNASKIQKKINELIQKAKSFTIFFNNLLNQSYIDQNAYNQLQRIDMEFNQKLSDFYGLLRDLSKLNTSQYLYHITKRMEGCLNPLKIPLGS